MQFSMALLSLSDNKHVKMAVSWKGRRVTLTERLFIDIATLFLDTNVAMDINLSGGANKGDVASRALVDGLCVMANIVPVTAQVISAAVFQTGHSQRVWVEMNSLVAQAVDETLPPLPVCPDRHSLDQVTFDAIETRLRTHFNVNVGGFRPGGPGREIRVWVSSIKLKYRNARRLMFAQAMAQYIATLEEDTHATRAKHYLFWMIVGPVRGT
jgi:hypothetical protein